MSRLTDAIGGSFPEDKEEAVLALIQSDEAWRVMAEALDPFEDVTDDVDRIQAALIAYLTGEAE